MLSSSSILASAPFERTRGSAVARLLALRNGSGHWLGRLSSSALATATAITALRLVDRELGTGGHPRRIGAGAAWLVATQLTDGSWGDTVASRGNASTTLLCWAALAAIADEPAAAAGDQSGVRAAIARAAAWIEAHVGGLDAATIVRGLTGLYGRDRTFSVPILTHVALCGRLGDPRDPATWQPIPQLPFALAALPQAWFRLVDMQVVSYALPALIAIGQVRHARAPGGGVARMIRAAASRPTLRTLAAIQPGNGGFLEATPLTSFVTMSLAGMGLAGDPVARRGVEFLAASQRTDGSWPIDTNLATWVTTQSVAALAAGGRLEAHLDATGRDAIRDWLLGQQWLATHPYTGAAAGGWAWTDLPGGVPDADDTSGAVAALAHLEAADRRPRRTDVARAAAAGLGWLADLANRDGGIPTFCRGWGRLPFDTSCPDITAHFLRAAAAWRERTDPRLSRRLARAMAAARGYLARTQQADGSWWPLWFGNEHHPVQANPTYGTARVVTETLDARGGRWLAAALDADGSVGGAAGLPPSIEETALAVEALAAVAAGTRDADLRSRALRAVEAGVRRLVAVTDEGTRFDAAPIGLYFAKLWYAEEAYPLAFSIAALERAAALARSTQ